MSTKLTASIANQSVVNVTRPVVRRRQVNWRLLIISFITLAALVPSIYAWHKFQLERVAEALLAKANRLDEEGKFGEASQYLHRYLQTETGKDSPDILARLAITYDKSVDTSGDKRTAIQWYYRALAAMPDRLDLRIRLAELFLETEQFVLAGDESDKCVLASPEDADALRIRALARAGQYREGRSISLQALIRDLEKANRLLPGDLTLAETLASLYRNKLVAADGPSRAFQADQVIDQMVQENPDLSRAYLTRYEYRVRHGLPGADEDLRRAIETDPENANVVFASASAAQRDGDFAAAEIRFRHAMERMPDDYRGPLGLGDAVLRSGRVDEALEIWRDAAEKISSGRLPLLVRLADTQIGLDRVAEATRTIKQIDFVIGRLAANGLESLRDWAVSTRDLLHAKLAVIEGRYDEAVTLLRRVASTAKADRPERAESSPSYQAWLLLGQTYVRMQRWEDAANSFERSLHAAPDSNTARIWAARCWNKVGQPGKSVALCEQAIERPPVPRSIWLMLAELHLRDQLGRPLTQRDWTPLRKLLQVARTKLPDSWEIRCLEATQLIAREAKTPSQLQENRHLAMQALAAAELAAPNSLAMWTRLIFYYDLLEQPEHVERALARVGQLSSNPALSTLYSAAVYARRGDYQQASDTLDLIPSLPDDAATSFNALQHQKHWFAAQAFRRNGQTDQAREEYERALELAPGHPELQIEFASFLRPLDRERSESMLRDLLRTQPNHPHARRLLATWLHWNSDEQSQLEARRLLSLAEHREAKLADRRLDATLHMRRGGDADLVQARQLLEKNLSEGGGVEDYRVLAKLCELQGDLDRARDYFRKLVNRPHPSAHDLANFVDYLLRTDQARVAERLLDRLESIAPVNFITFNLRLRYMAAVGETESLDRYADKYIEEWESTDLQPANAIGVLQQVARLLEELDRVDAAEKWLLRLAEERSNHEPLAFFWVRQGRVDQAVELCERKAREETSPANATVLARVLLRVDEPSPTLDACMDLVVRIRDENPRDAELRFAVASLHLIRQANEEAIEELRIVTELAPDHFVAWNNLAAILKDHEEAMECINQAITVAGRPLPMLLDTKSVLLIQQHEYEEAIALLKQAVGLASDSRFQLHLAFALLRTGANEKSREAWDRALELGLESAYLTDYERAWMGELTESLAVEDNPS